MMPQSKKQKLDGAEKNPVVYFDPKRIPIEVWESIFLHNSARDLLNLSLVCKKFYNAIGSLPEAMDKIVVKQERKTEKDKKSLLNSSRNYKNFKFEYIQIIPDMKIRLKIIKKFGDNLRSLEFSSCYFIDEEFNKILEMSQKNLRSLTIYGRELKKTTRYSEITAPKVFKLPKLQSLEIKRFYESVIIKNVFECAPDTLRELTFDCQIFSDGSQFVKFLQRQKNLEHLNLFAVNDEFLNKIGIVEFNFKLEKLQANVPISIENSKKFAEFLKFHAGSLKELTLLTNTLINELYDVFSNMPNLEWLKFECFKAATTQEYENGPNFDCPALKTLIMVVQERNPNASYLNFFKKFQNISKIELRMQSSSSMMKISAENHPNLKSLKFHGFTNSFFSGSFNNLTELQIDFGALTEINLLNFVLAMENLEFLKFGSNVSVSAVALCWMLVQFKKLKHMEIYDGSKLSDDWLCKNLELFKNLKILKILNLRESIENFIEGLIQYPNLKFLC